MFPYYDHKVTATFSRKGNSNGIVNEIVVNLAVSSLQQFHTSILLDNTYVEIIIISVSLF